MRKARAIVRDRHLGHVAPRAHFDADLVPGETAGVPDEVGQHSVEVLTVDLSTCRLPHDDDVRAVVFAPPQLVGFVTGGVRGTPIRARVTLTTVPVGGRLAVIRRETE